MDEFHGDRTAASLHKDGSNVHIYPPPPLSTFVELQVSSTTLADVDETTHKNDTDGAQVDSAVLKRDLIAVLSLCQKNRDWLLLLTNHLKYQPFLLILSVLVQIMTMSCASLSWIGLRMVGRGIQGLLLMRRGDLLYLPNIDFQ